MGYYSRFAQTRLCPPMKSYDLSNVSVLVVEKHSHMRTILRQVLRQFGIANVFDAATPPVGFQRYKDSYPDIVILDWAPDFDGLALVTKIRTGADGSFTFSSATANGLLEGGLRLNVDFLGSWRQFNEGRTNSNTVDSDDIRIVISGQRSTTTVSGCANAWVPVIMCTANTEKRHIVEARDAGATEYLLKPVSAKSIYDRIVSVVDDARPFVRTKAFTGPDRRRSAMPYGGAERRKENQAMAIPKPRTVEDGGEKQPEPKPGVKKPKKAKAGGKKKTAAKGEAAEPEKKPVADETAEA